MKGQGTSGDNPTHASVAEAAFVVQRQLRKDLLDGPAIRYRPARDLAAHMLLNLEDLSGCWGLATDWLRAQLSCHRVDTGFGSADKNEYFPGFSEAKDTDFDVPSFGGLAVDNTDPIMRAMWSGNQPVIFADIKQDRRVTPALRRRMAGAKTKSKFGAALRTKNGSFGLICADWTEHQVPQDSDLYDRFEQTVTDVLCPIIDAAKRLADARDNTRQQSLDNVSTFQYGRQNTGPLDSLTSSEREVGRLVAQGLSYKEIARVRGRSPATIDHQLRSLRKKLGVSSTAGLISRLARLDGFAN